jgi:hypothetical protein
MTDWLWSQTCKDELCCVLESLLYRDVAQTLLCHSPRPNLIPPLYRFWSSVITCRDITIGDERRASARAEEIDSSPTIQHFDRIPWVGAIASLRFQYTGTHGRWAEVYASPFTKVSRDAKTKLQRGLNYKNQMTLISNTRNDGCVSFTLTWGKTDWRHQLN